MPYKKCSPRHFNMPVNIGFADVVPGRLELPTSTLSVWRSNQLSYRTVVLTFPRKGVLPVQDPGAPAPGFSLPLLYLKNNKQTFVRHTIGNIFRNNPTAPFQKGGVPAAPSGTATLLRLSPNHRFHPRPTLAVTDFRRPRLSWLDGRCVQGPGTYSPRHG